MRLELFRNLSATEQKKETARSIERIQSAYKELCGMGKWSENSSKELKEKGNAILWKSNSSIL